MMIEYTTDRDPVVYNKQGKMGFVRQQYGLLVSELRCVVPAQEKPGDKTSSCKMANSMTVELQRITTLL
jgi:hypothetical protein